MPPSTCIPFVRILFSHQHLIKLYFDFLASIRNVGRPELTTDLSRVKISANNYGTCNEKTFAVSLMAPRCSATRNVTA